MTGSVTTIALQKKTVDVLKKISHKGETYDQLINKLIGLSRKQLFIERQKNILENEEFVELEKV